MLCLSTCVTQDWLQYAQSDSNYWLIIIETNKYKPTAGPQCKPQHISVAMINIYICIYLYWQSMLGSTMCELIRTVEHAKSNRVYNKSIHVHILRIQYDLSV